MQDGLDSTRTTKRAPPAPCCLHLAGTAPACQQACTTHHITSAHLPASAQGGHSSSVPQGHTHGCLSTGVVHHRALVAVVAIAVPHTWLNTHSEIWYTCTTVSLLVNTTSYKGVPADDAGLPHSPTHALAATEQQQTQRARLESQAGW